VNDNASVVTDLKIL